MKYKLDLNLKEEMVKPSHESLQSYLGMLKHAEAYGLETLIRRIGIRPR